MPGFGLGFKRLILVLGDLAVYQAALALMLIVRYGSLTERDWELHAIPFAIVSLLWVVGAYVAGLYDLNQMKNGVKFFRLYLEGMLANLAVAFAFFYLVQIFGIAQHAVAHVLGGQAAFVFIVKTDFVVASGREMDDVLRDGTAAHLLADQATRFDVHRTTALF